MYPILFEFGPVVVPAWHAFYLLGAIAAYYLMVKRRQSIAPEISEKEVNSLYITCYLGGYFGARLLSVFIDELQVKGMFDTIAALFRLGPMTFYGGAIGCALCGLIYIVLKKLPFAPIYDLCIPAGLLALGIGRVGCFLNGDDYGKAVDVSNGIPWWSVVFPNLRDGVARYPVQLISTTVCFIIVLLLITQGKKIRTALGPGSIGILGTASYANYRFIIEFWRGDPRGSLLSGLLTTSQFISVLVLLALMLIVTMKMLRQKSAPLSKPHHS